MIINNKKIGMLGGGSFGIAFANLILQANCFQWINTDQIQEIILNRKSSSYLKGIEIHPNIKPSIDLKKVIQDCDIIFIALHKH